MSRDVNEAGAVDNGAPRLELKGEEVDVPVNFDDIGGDDG